jgi:hypothetical protein
MKFLAGAVWLQLTVNHLRHTRAVSAAGADNRFALLASALQAVRDNVRSYFPALRDTDWATIEAYARRELRYLSEHKGHLPLQVVPGGDGRFVLTEGDRVTAIRAPVSEALKNGRYNAPFLAALLRAEWLIPGRPHAGPPMTQAGEVIVFGELYDAVQWWTKAVKAAYYSEATRGQDTDFARRSAETYEATRQEVGDWVRRLEAGRYPKHPGKHCQYCPVRGECLGLDP